MANERLFDLDKHERENLRLRLALLKENASYRKFWEQHGGEKFLNAYFSIDVNLPVEEKVRTPEFIEAEDFVSRLREFDIDSPFRPDDKRVKEFVHLIDPYSLEDLPAPLPFPVFTEYPSVAGVFSAIVPSEARYRISDKAKLRPSERLLRIDLSRSRGELLDDFRRFLDRVDYFREAEDCPPDWRENYEGWEPDKSRLRAEAWQALAVYRFRRQHKAYKEISRTLDIPIPRAKKAFARAYELIEARPYDPDYFKREVQAVKLPELRKTCDTCPIRDTCTELCPDVLPFLEQDEVKEHDLYMKNIRNETFHNMLHARLYGESDKNSESNETD